MDKMLWKCFAVKQRHVIPCFLIMSLFFLCSLWFFTSDKCIWHHKSVKSDGLSNSEMQRTLKMLQSVDFEVFGRVQGVFFRKFTREKGKELGLKGWVMNTSQGTVTGTIQGKEEKVEEMKNWLSHTGSPHSNIEKCIFKNVRHISKEEFDEFYVKH